MSHHNAAPAPDLTTPEGVHTALDLLAQVLDTAYETDLLSDEQYDAVGGLVWGTLARYAGVPDNDLDHGARPDTPSPEVLNAALDLLATSS